MVEILAAMTILAIAGSVLMRSLQNAVAASSTVQDITKAIYLTEAKLNEFKLAVDRRYAPELGEFRGGFTQPGAGKFQWTAWVEHDRELDAYVITVQTTWGDQAVVRRRRNYRSGIDGGFVLKTMVPRARINEELMFGGAPQVDRRGESRNSRGQGGSRGRGGSRGGSRR